MGVNSISQEIGGNVRVIVQQYVLLCKGLGFYSQRPIPKSLNHHVLYVCVGMIVNISEPQFVHLKWGY